MLRSVDGGGEVDLDKRAITGEDDIIELDQLPTQHTGPEAKDDGSDPTPAQGAEGAAAAAPPTIHAKTRRRIVVLGGDTSEELASRDARHLDRPITAAPETPVAPGTVQLPASLRPAGGASSDSPEFAPQAQRDRPSPPPTLGRTLRRRPRRAAAATILVLALTAAGTTTLGAGGSDHRAHNPRTTASRATISVPISPTVPGVAIDTRHQPSQARRPTSRHQAHPKRHRHSVTGPAPATDAATQQSGGSSQAPAPSYTPVSAVHSQTPTSQPSSTSGSSVAPTHTPTSSNGTSTQVSKATLKALVTGAGTCGCQ